ncbi:hypothetical protein N7517_006324 [Penicillium concentricum]|uniref:Uncharacterized protein n=1 Tax=Penicillium concentricum TaxID=293559 RepID=A0A9W9V9W5_9EURO|nr:uncharacterized protein N7517_006324 [Penicillium concentricum]KAJ5374318.1 hypothetical protein N7517_006324 [Penicillium concentricum]
MSNPGSSFLSFGGATGLRSSSQADFVQGRASEVFIFGGMDGAGETTEYLEQDPGTAETVRLARNAEKERKDGRPVLPVIISYTVNFSCGDSHNKLENNQALAHGFGNLILSLQVAEEGRDAENSTPATYVVNPDFLSICEAENLGPDYVLPVRMPLQEALDFRGVPAQIPDSITDDLRGYVLAVNWLVRTVAPAVSFGWSVSPQATKDAKSVYDADAKASTEAASQVVNYVKSFGVFDSYSPDFLAVDRYEADDFTARSYVNSYSDGPSESGKFSDFANTLGTDLSVPVMLWDITGSRIPSINDNVEGQSDSQHWGTGGSYILGDSNIGSKIPNLEPHSLSFLERGVFTVLLGKGTTTGIEPGVSQPEPWVSDK